MKVSGLPVFWGSFSLMLLATLIGSFVLSLDHSFRLFSGLLVLSCICVLPFLRRLEKEHARGSWMWWTWRLLWLSNLAEAMRHGIDFLSSFQYGPMAYQLRGISLIPTIFSISLELASLILIWVSFHSIGIQKPFAKKDWVFIAVISFLVVFCFVEHQYLPHATALHHVFRKMEFANPPLFAAGIVMAMLLYRLSRDLGEGDLALSILFLALQLASRFVGFAIETLRYRFHIPNLLHVSNVFYWSSAWFIVWSILLRYRMTLKAQNTVRVYENLRSQTAA